MTSSTRRPHRAFAVLLAVTAAGALLEIAAALDRPDELQWYRLVSFSYLVVGAVVFGVVARAVLDRDRRHPIGLLLMLMACSPASSVLANGYTAWSLPGSTAVTWAGWCVAAPAMVTLAGAMMLFPTGRLPSRRWRWLGWSAIAVGVAATVLAAFTPWPYPPYPNDTYVAENPLGIEALRGSYGAVLGMSFLVLVGSVVSVGARWRRTRGVERDQIRVLGFAGVIVAVTIVSAVVGAFAGDFDTADSAAFDFVVGDGIFSLGVSALAVSIGIGVVRYRLYGIDRLMSRTATSATLLVVTGVGLGLAAAVGAAIVGGAAPPAVFVVAMAVTVAVLQPVRRRLGVAIDQRVFGGRSGAWEALRDLVRGLGDGADGIAGAVAVAARDVTGARAARAVVAMPDGSTVETVVGDRSVDRWDPVIEVGSHDVVVGTVAISAGDGRRSDVRALERVAATTGGAMANLQLEARLREAYADIQATNRELAASHQRLLVAADSELDRLRVDVRQRLDPVLRRVFEQLGRARTAAIDDDSHRVAETVAVELLPTSVALVEEIRSLARGVFPPILTDLGVTAAVRALVRRLAGELRVELDDAVGRERFDADAEAAGFLCCRALLDDACGAHAQVARLRLACGGGFLIVNGSYTGDDLATPTALDVARDRVTALGGRFDLDGGRSVRIDVAIPSV